MITPPAAPDGYEAHVLYVPSGAQYKGLVLGALLPLLDSWRWEQLPGTISASEAVGAFSVMLSRYQEAHVMIGAIFATVGAVPANALELNGQTVSRDDYPLLYDAAPPQWRHGADILGLPDASGATILGVQDNDTLGTLQGHAEHQLSEEHLPAHSHGYIMPGADIDVEQPVGVPIPSAGLGVPSITDTAGWGMSFPNTPLGIVVRLCVWAK